MACTVLPTTYAPTPYDDEIAALNFQLEEIERTTSSSKGKHRADEPQDLELAFAAFQAEIQQHILYIEDARFARSLANALDTDTSMLDEFVGGDIQFQADRELALQLCTDVPDLEAASPNLCSPAFSSPNLGGSPDLGFNEFLRALSHGTTAASSVPQAALNASCFITGTVVADTIASRRMTVAVKAEPSNHGTQNTQKTQETLPTKDTSVTTEPQKATVVHNDALQTESCSCCTEEMKVGEMVKVPCGHSYCKRCLKDMFNKSTKNEDLFPPRCCSQHIPLQHIISSMDWDEARQFQIAELAFRTPNKTYCSNPICGSFIFPENVFGEIAQCQTCRKETCIHCKSVGHAGDCPKDTNLQATLATAKEQGWQRCTSCQRVVELKIGCNHIVCLCGHPFCYLCGKKWRTCLCEQFSERHLVRPTEVTVPRQPPVYTTPVQKAAQMVDAQQKLLERRDCTHSGTFEKLEVQPEAKTYGRVCEMCAMSIVDVGLITRLATDLSKNVKDAIEDAGCAAGADLDEKDDLA